ncbi:MAG TPA: glycosyl hydrolase family 18 protein [Chitinophagaceae bacterium]|nr:glycosyl hydrolase family 18 protein [Chitinophagaceae bacterium]
MPQKLIRTFLLTCLIFIVSVIYAQKKNAAKTLAVFGYYEGRPSMIDSFSVNKLTHLCFSFTHLKGNKIAVTNLRDSIAIKNCVAAKRKNPNLKVIISMGGWTGCYTCSEIFSADSSRKIFASSVKKLLNDFKLDGIDLDWEYPAIKGPPMHPYHITDKENFTALIKTLRDSLGEEKEISFAAGGFTAYINESVEWKKVAPLVNRINLMTYDLITGYDTVTGHHTALYSTAHQKESCNNAVKMLIKKGVPKNKLLIGAAFYARIWENVSNINNGLYQKGNFLKGVSYKYFTKLFSSDSGYVYHFDKKAMAATFYNAQKKWFVTFDNSISIAAKTKYAIKKHLNGIMFWQLADDSFTNGLLDVIDKTKL